MKLPEAMSRAVLTVTVLLLPFASSATQTKHEADFSSVTGPIVGISRYMACFSQHKANEDMLRVGARVLAKHRLAAMVASSQVSMVEAEEEAATTFNHGYEYYQDALNAKAPMEGGCSDRVGQAIERQFREQSDVMETDVKAKNFDPFPIPARDKAGYAKETLKQCILFASMAPDGPKAIVATPSQAAKLCNSELGEYRYSAAVARGVDRKTAQEQANAYYQSNDAITDVKSIQRLIIK